MAAALKVIRCAVGLRPRPLWQVAKAWTEVSVGQDILVWDVAGAPTTFCNLVKQ